MMSQLCFVKTDTTFEHEKAVTDLACYSDKNLIISGSLDGYVRVWNLKKELIREIKFPEPIYSVSFLNSQADIIIGHMGKVSTVSHKDYCPFEIQKLCAPSKEDVSLFYSKKQKMVCDEVFYHLKARDDELKKQNQLLKQKVARPKMVIASPSNTLV